MQPSVEARPGTTPGEWRSGGTVVGVVALLSGTFVVARLAAFGWDPSAFIVAGDGITDPSVAPDNLGINHGTDGYDGQAYYRLSRDPLTSEVTEHGIGFRRPAYWQARIGYPAVVWVVSVGGSESLVPTAMLLVNLLAVLAVTAVAVVLARDAGRSPWLALIPGLFGGYLVGISQDLSEPVQGALLLSAVLALRRHAWWCAVLLLTAAALTRETSLILAAAVVAVAIVGRWRATSSRPPVWVGLVPIVGYAGWRTWVRSRWSDAVPAPPGDNIVTWPLWGLLREVGVSLVELPTHAGNLVLVVLAVAVVVLLGAQLTQPAAGLPHERVALAAYLLLLVCLPVWDRNQAYLRWCCEPVLLGSVVLLGTRWARRRIVTLGAVVIVLWAATALATVRHPGTDGWTGAVAAPDREQELEC